MGKFEDYDKESLRESHENQEGGLSALDLLRAEHHEATEAISSKQSNQSLELFRTNAFAQADSSIREDAAKIGQLFTNQDRNAILANMPDRA